MTRRAELAQTLESARSVAVRAGIADAASWRVGTRGGTYLYLVAEDGSAVGRRVLDLGPTVTKAQARLHSLIEDMHLVES